LKISGSSLIKVLEFKYPTFPFSIENFSLLEQLKNIVTANKTRM